MCVNADIIVLTETWLNETVCSNMLFGNNYNVFRRDRMIDSNSKKKDGGGVLIAVKKHISSKNMIEWQGNCEDLWVIINTPINNKLCHMVLCVVYLPPPVNKALLETFLANYNSV